MRYINSSNNKSEIQEDVNHIELIFNHLKIEWHNTSYCAIFNRAWLVSRRRKTFPCNVQETTCLSSSSSANQVSMWKMQLLITIFNAQICANIAVIISATLTQVILVMAKRMRYKWQKNQSYAVCSLKYAILCISQIMTPISSFQQIVVSLVAILFFHSWHGIAFKSLDSELGPTMDRSNLCYCHFVRHLGYWCSVHILLWHLHFSWSWQHYATSASTTITACITAIYEWLPHNCLALNPHKSESVLFGTATRIGPLRDVVSVNVARTPITLSSRVSDSSLTKI